MAKLETSFTYPSFSLVRVRLAPLNKKTRLATGQIFKNHGGEKVKYETYSSFEGVHKAESTGKQL